MTRSSLRAGGRSSNIISSVRHERPSSIVAPNRDNDGAAVDLTTARSADRPGGASRSAISL